MELTEFTYRKDTGQVTSRAVVVVNKPTANLSGYDVTELDADDTARFLDAYREIRNDFHAQLDNLLQAFDLKYSYKQFKPANITDQHITNI
jgi:hypothetical protein